MVVRMAVILDLIRCRTVVMPSLLVFGYEEDNHSGRKCEVKKTGRPLRVDPHPLKMYPECMPDSQSHGPALSPGEFHKVTVNLIPKSWDAANETAERLGLSRTDVINRALQAYAFLEQATAEGAQIVITRKTGSEVVRFL